MAEAAELRERMERILECPICFDQFVSPKVLPCQHTYCKACLESLVTKKSSIKCPNCRRRHKFPENGIEGLPPNVTIAELIELQSAAAPEVEPDETETELVSQVENLSNTVRYLRGISEASDESLVIEQRGESIKAEIGHVFTKYREILQDRERHLQGKVDVIVERDLRLRSEWREQVRERLGEATALTSLARANISGDLGEALRDPELSSQLADLSRDTLKVAFSMPVTSQYQFTFGSNVLKTHITTYGSIIKDSTLPEQTSHKKKRATIKDGVLEDEGQGHPIVVNYYPTNEPLYVTDIDPVDDIEFSPFGLTTAPSGNIIATDIENHRVVIFTSELQVVTIFGRLGSGNGELNRPTGIVTDSDGNIFVADQLNHRVQVFDACGAYREQFGEKGSNPGQFVFPCGLSIDKQNRIYVCDSGNFRVQILEKDGGPVTCFGSRDLFLNQPMHVTVTSQNHVIVTDQKQYIHKFIDGQHKQKLYMSQPSGVVVDPFGNLVVGDSCGRVVVLSDAGEALCHIGTCGKGPGQLVEPRGVTLTGEGNIAVGDGLVHRIQIFHVEITHDVTDAKDS